MTFEICSSIMSYLYFCLEICVFVHFDDDDEWEQTCLSECLKNKQEKTIYICLKKGKISPFSHLIILEGKSVCASCIDAYE